MPKNIIVCTDGTWDHPDSKDPNVGTTPDETNVFKLFSLLPGEAQIRPAGVFVKSIQGQTAFYDDGVGADGIWAVRIAEGTTGAGLELKLQAGYRFISEQYEDGDRIYLFGFSRGMACCSRRAHSPMREPLRSPGIPSWSRCMIPTNRRSSRFTLPCV